MFGQGAAAEETSRCPLLGGRGFQLGEVEDLVGLSWLGELGRW
jgi:hypothetical protein